MQTVRGNMETVELLSLTVAVTLSPLSVFLCFERILGVAAFCAELPDILQDLSLWNRCLPHQFVDIANQAGD